MCGESGVDISVMRYFETWTSSPLVMVPCSCYSKEMMAPRLWCQDWEFGMMLSLLAEVRRNDTVRWWEPERLRLEERGVQALRNYPPLCIHAAQAQDKERRERLFLCTTLLCWRHWKALWSRQSQTARKNYATRWLKIDASQKGICLHQGLWRTCLGRWDTARNLNGPIKNLMRL